MPWMVQIVTGAVLSSLAGAATAQGDQRTEDTESVSELRLPAQPEAVLEEI